MEEVKTIIKMKKTDDPEYHKKYYLNNKGSYLKRGIERKEIFVDCEICRCKLVKKGWQQHRRTTKHVNNILINNI